VETLAELPFIGDQVVRLSHDQGARSGPAERTISRKDSLMSGSSSLQRHN